MNNAWWQIRRELWENRSLYLAPIGACCVFLLAFVVPLSRLPRTIREAAALDPLHQRAAIAFPYDILGGLLMGVLMLVGAFYCLDALYGERRDRSMLFWKSLPVPDLTAVLAKASIPILFLPLVTWIVTLAAWIVMLVMSTLVLSPHPANVALLWQGVAIGPRSLLLLYHLLTVHSLYLAPIYGWLLLVSAWARRATFVWAFVPPVAIASMERLAFGTTFFAHLLLDRLGGNGMDAVVAHGTFPMDPHTHVTPIRFLLSPGLLGGLVIFSLCVMAAVRLRRDRSAI